MYFPMLAEAAERSSRPCSGSFAMQMFASMVSRKMRSSAGTSPMCGRRFSEVAESAKTASILPDAGRYSPEMSFRRVLFPPPLSPTIPTTFPLSKAALAPLRTSVPS